MAETVQDDRLADFVTACGEAGVTARTLAHAWEGGGGRLAIGKLTVRFIQGQEAGQFTAATLHVPRAGRPANLEFARVLLESHGVGADAWIHWSDEFADLAHHGFDAATRFPTLRLDADLSPSEVARLAAGLRDLATMAGDAA